MFVYACSVQNLRQGASRMVNLWSLMVRLWLCYQPWRWNKSNTRSPKDIHDSKLLVMNTFFQGMFDI